MIVAYSMQPGCENVLLRNYSMKRTQGRRPSSWKLASSCECFCSIDSAREFYLVPMWQSYATTSRNLEVQVLLHGH